METYEEALKALLGHRQTTKSLGRRKRLLGFITSGETRRQWDIIDKRNGVKPDVLVIFLRGYRLLEYYPHHFMFPSQAFPWSRADMACISSFTPFKVNGTFGAAPMLYTGAGARVAYRNMKIAPDGTLLDEFRWMNSYDAMDYYCTIPKVVTKNIHALVYGHVKYGWGRFKEEYMENPKPVNHSKVSDEELTKWAQLNREPDIFFIFSCMMRHDYIVKKYYHRIESCRPEYYQHAYLKPKTTDDELAHYSRQLKGVAPEHPKKLYTVLQQHMTLGLKRAAKFYQ